MVGQKSGQVGEGGAGAVGVRVGGGGLSGVSGGVIRGGSKKRFR